jgi:cysteine-rich repeat protein
MSADRIDRLRLARAGLRLVLLGLLVIGVHNGAAAGKYSDCCEPHVYKGCDEPVCKNYVCGFDPSCCTVTWDSICAEEANLACSTCGGNPNCGNDALDPGEQCDDGNIFDGDGCGSTCTLEPACDCCLPDPQGAPYCNSPPCRQAVCAVHPECCQVSWTAACADAAGRLCSCCIPNCGNGTVDAGEQCDDGALVDGDGCSSFCRYEICGNGFIDLHETCDDGNTTSGDGCSSNCQDEACGNGTIDVNEQCDDGNTEGTDDCTQYCMFAICGDGIPHYFSPSGSATEQCDDGNASNGDDCSNDCHDARCGDGFQKVQPPEMEQCDDGNQQNGDGCSATCKIEPACDCCVEDPAGATGCNEAACQGTVCAIDAFCCNGSWDSICATEANSLCACCSDHCGNWTLNPGEECDDGNLTDGDGCSSTCTNEPACDCCVEDPAGAPECNDQVCRDKVCASHPLCCSSAWDSACAAAAAQDCTCCGSLPGDIDGDGTPDTQDNCVWTYNPGKGVALFAGVVRALDRQTFGWTKPQTVVWVRGPLEQVADYAYEGVGIISQGSTTIQAPQEPQPGEGLYWLLRPMCPSASWSSGGATEVPGARDAALP